MKFEIYEADKLAAKPPVFLRLIEVASGINVAVVDAAGNTHTQGHLLSFKNDGTVHILRGVSSVFGFKLTADHGILVTS